MMPGRGVAPALVAFGAAGLATALVSGLHPFLEAGSFMLFIAAVAAAGTRGRVSGLLCTLLSVAAIDFFFLTPRFTLAVVAWADVLLLAVFSIVALLVSWFADRQRQRLERELLRTAGAAALLERQLNELERDLDASETLRRGRRR